MKKPKKFTNSKECVCRPGPCKVHNSHLKTICYHCHAPQEGMNFECDACTKRRAALEKAVAKADEVLGLMEARKYGDGSEMLPGAMSSVASHLRDNLNAITHAEEEK